MIFEHTNITLGAAVSTSILNLLLDEIHRGGSIEISNDGANALTALEVDCQDHPNGEFYSVVSATGFATLTQFLTYSTATPASLAAGSKAHLHFDFDGVHAIRIKATSTSGTILSVRGCASEITKI